MIGMRFPPAMPLSNLVTHAAVQAFAEVIGASGAAHALALALWVPAPEPAEAAAAATGLGTGLAIVIATRSRLGPALADGARALVHPSMFRVSARARDALVIVWIAGVSALGGWLLRRAGGAAPPSPRNLALGLAATGLAILAAAHVTAARSEPGARSGERGAGREERRVALRPLEAPSLLAATLAGAAHACGAWPGVSRPGVAAAVLLLCGVKPARALELALLATVPFWWADFAAMGPGIAALGAGNALAVGLFAFLGALGALALLRALSARRSLGALSLWILPLACAIFAYGRAGAAASTLAAARVGAAPATTVPLP